jgi:hypothetical protein
MTQSTTGVRASLDPKQAALLDLGVHLDSIGKTTDALKGIGSMLYPESRDEDFQMNMTKVSEVSAVFDFFGETLESHSKAAVDAMHRLGLAVAGESK